MPAENVDLKGQRMTIDQTASESGGRRDVREDMRARAAVRLVMIPAIALPAVRRLLERQNWAASRAKDSTTPG